MCGIAGKYNYLSKRQIEKTTIEAMANILSPGGSGNFRIFVEGNLSLGHHNISNTSGKGRQPIFSNDGNLVIVCDGEIYNFLELKRKLKNKGHLFHSETDTEVILAMYREHGERCLDYFNGMFAFAIWDKKEKSLFIARDRLGIKPLYYTLTREGISFASEIKGILQDKDIQISADPKGVYAFMTFGYVPGENTIFKGINRLPPGYTLTVSSGKIIKFQYWDIPSKDIQTDKGLPAYISDYKNILWDSVKLRLRGNNPPGAFLSGGLDSSALVAIANQYTEGPVKTFSIGYNF
ncbi:MAG: asparagine synthase (glutamine-hydrolyzing), partial [Desulfobacteraceae bacterium 4484_190.1]